MNVDTLIRQLTLQIEEQLSSKVLATEIFTIPFSTLEISYLPVLKKRMDILMKMLLTSFQSGVFTTPDQLASILMVEELFINDLTKQMEKSKLIELDEVYKLTAKGEGQLKEGIYEEQMPVETIEMLYSTLHEQLFSIDIDTLELEHDLPEPLANFEDDQDITFDEAMLTTSIQKHLQDNESELIVQEIENIETVELYDFPYILFICHDEKIDRLYSRAYNIYTNEWDDGVAKFMDKEQLIHWRAQYLST